jgi:S-layer protein
VTLRPTDATAAGFDLSGTGADTSAFSGVRAVDLTQSPGAASYVLAAPTTAGATFPVTFSSASATAIGDLSITQAGSGTADALTVTQSNASANVGAITTPGIETLTINLGGTAGTTATKTLGAVTMDATAATQALTVTSNAAATTAGAVTADSLNTTGVVGTFTGSFTGGIASAVFTGSTTQPSFFTTSRNNDIVTTGSGNDAIYNPATGTGIVNLNGGLGNDTYQFGGTNANGSIITDTGGIDNLVMGGAGLNISAVSSGATLASMGIDRVYVNGTGALTVATGQIGAQTLNNVNLGGATAVITLAAAGTLNASSLVFTQVTTDLALSATGAALAAPAAITALTLNGSSGADTITGSALVDTITGGALGDTITGGSGADVFRYGVRADIVGAAGVNVDKIADFTTTSDKINLTSGGAASAVLAGITMATTTTVNTIPAAISVATSVATIADVYTALTANVAASGGLEAASLLASTAGVADATAGLHARLVTFTTGAAAGTYLIVNDSTAGFLAANDLVIQIVGTVVAADFTFTA